MSCKKFRILLSAYLDREITKDKEKELLNHLNTCVDCVRELEYLKQIKRMFILKGKKEPQEFFETRLFELIKNKRKQLIWQLYFPVIKRTIMVIIIFFLIIAGWVNYKKLLYHRTTETISDLLVDDEIDENFQEELLVTYYSPLK